MLGGSAGIASSINFPYFNANHTFVGNTLKNNKVLQYQSIIKANIQDDWYFTFKVFNFNPVTSNMEFSYEKYVLNQSHYNVLSGGQEFHGQGGDNGCYFNSYLEVRGFLSATGDFNGDGITDVIIRQKFGCDRVIDPPTQVYIEPSGGNAGYYTNVCHRTDTCTSVKTLFIDLKEDVSTTFGSTGYTDIQDFDDIMYNYPASNGQFSSIQYLDYNGDGKADIMNLYEDGHYIIATLNFNNVTPFITCEKIGEGNLNYYSPEKPLYSGDYNGDGKVDFMIPVAENSPWWSICYSNQSPTAGSFFTQLDKEMPFLYQPYQAGETYQDFRTYYTMDINNDGKTDLVSIKRARFKVPCTLSDFDTDYVIKVFTNNIGFSSGSFTQTFDSGVIGCFSDYTATPFVGNFSLNNKNAQIIMWQHDRPQQCRSFNFKRDFLQDNLLKTVTESSGNIVQTIDYTPMNNNDVSAVYQTYIEPDYPFVCVKRNSNNFLVNKHTASINGFSKFQDFSYRNMVSNFEYGTIGFKSTDRSSWYTNTLTNKIWTNQQIDIYMRGANKITTTSCNGNMLSTKTNEFETYTNPTTKVYNVQLKKQTTIDNLTYVTNETNFTYDGLVDSATAFGLQTQSISNTFLGTTLQGITTVDTTFENNATGVGSAYYVGKPKTVETSKTIYPSDASKTDTRTSKELYNYTGANLTQIEKRGHNTTNPIFENMTYDNFGNLLTKTISCLGASPTLANRTITDVYDPLTKRFVINKTDHQGFQTLLEYNNIGQVTKSTNYLGVANDFVFDNWGKLTLSTITGASLTPLTTTTSYSKFSDGSYRVATLNLTGESSNTTYNVIGQIIQTVSNQSIGNPSGISQETAYDALGRKLNVSEPHFYTTPTNKKTSYTYDFLNRPLTVTAPTGRIQTINYYGLTTSSLDDTKTTTATADALGNKISTTDEGGTINFKYYANGQVKETDYGGHIISVAIDGWGNKTSMNDPNAGTYTYVTDEFGQSKTETTPKGTTNYLYDNFGKLITKTILGDGADYVTTYAYNGFAQLTSEVSKKANNTAIDSFNYGYDSLKRLKCDNRKQH